MIFKNAERLNTYLVQQKKQQHSIGFVPTMGALHQGHLSLIEESKKNNALSVCSIFVNPTQFNNASDFQNYPYSLEKDIDQLIATGCDVVFLPAIEEIYPPAQSKKIYELGDIEKILEGVFRPGHFQGVCQVVDKLLQIVQPHNLYLGQKDFQQCMVIKKLLTLIHLENKIQLQIVPTVRESDGLAMSSRNLRLNETERKNASAIFKALQFVKNNINHQKFEQLKLQAIKYLEHAGFKVDYVEIANISNLSVAENKEEPIVALAAATINNIRLIDNLVLN